MDGKTKGKLYMIPTPLGENDPMEVLPHSVKTIVSGLKVFVVENEKSARAFLKKMEISTPQNELRIYVLGKHTDKRDIPSFLNACDEGENIGVISEAGFPAIADPGSDLVRIAHHRGIRVVPLVGPTSFALALMASGLNGQQFAFHGYLPIDGRERIKAIKNLEKESARSGATQLFMETPFRNRKLVEDLLSSLAPDTDLCIACNINQTDERIVTKKVREWKKSEAANFDKKPALFLIAAT
jgi:16S rRNA (cytidine1402-2'-O)-methyltransferase